MRFRTLKFETLQEGCLEPKLVRRRVGNVRPDLMEGCLVSHVRLDLVIEVS